MADLTAKEALDLIASVAQDCRANGESDMRTILNVVRGIKGRIDAGETGQEIIEAYAPDEDDDEWHITQS